jgi:Domain of unknown function (DUF6487)
MTETSAPPLARNCPTCGGPMEYGHVLGQPAMSWSPVTIGWMPGTVHPSGRGIQDQLNAEPLVPVGIFALSAIPRFPAWRCTKCSVVEFTYNNAIVKSSSSDATSE